MTLPEKAENAVESNTRIESYASGSGAVSFTRIRGPATADERQRYGENARLATGGPVRLADLHPEYVLKTVGSYESPEDWSVSEDASGAQLFRRVVRVSPQEVSVAGAGGPFKYERLGPQSVQVLGTDENGDQYEARRFESSVLFFLDHEETSLMRTAQPVMDWIRGLQETAGVVAIVPRTMQE